MKSRRKIIGIVAAVLSFLILIASAGCASAGRISRTAEVSAQSESTKVSAESETTEVSIQSEAAEGRAQGETEETSAAVPASTPSSNAESAPQTIDLDTVPAYSGSPYIALNDNIPEFPDSDLVDSSFETYGALDSMGRCSVAYACIDTDIMPEEKRGSIGQVKPSGWKTIKYDFVDGKYLYNRCHLIGFQLTGENANTKNLITGTRYLNTEGMLPFENMVADYIKETGNHVLYRVTPVFEGDNLLASGVHMEAESVEDEGEGILFNVYCYNVQPGVDIDYATGESSASGTDEASPAAPAPEESNAPAEAAASSVDDTPDETSVSQEKVQQTYVLNTSTHKFHVPTCSSIKQMSEKNKEVFTGTRDEVTAMGYDPCGRCKP